MLYHVLRSSTLIITGQRSLLRRGLSTATQQRQQQERRREYIDRVIRVDHAGEFGADRIYAGQMAILANSKAGETIDHMWQQEKEHLKLFNELVDKHKARPSALLPLWNVAGKFAATGAEILSPRPKSALDRCTISCYCLKPYVCDNH